VIPVTLPRSTEKYRSPRWTLCVDCLQMFKKRPGSTDKINCVMCESLRDDARRAALKKVHAEVKAGRLPHPTTLKCVDCGDHAMGYEHRSYSKPLEVEPICHSCNSLRGPAAL
jgi:hypothetical protein